MDKQHSFIEALKASEELDKINFCEIFAPKIFKDKDGDLVNWKKFWNFLLKNQDIFKHCGELYIKFATTYIEYENFKKSLFIDIELDEDTYKVDKVMKEIDDYKDHITKEYRVRKKREKRKHKK